MEQRFAQQIKKGVLDMIVLRLICEEDTYGYGLLQKLEQRGGGYFDLKEGTLYPVLYRLEDAGLIRSAWQASGERRAAPKKYYSATEAGRARYAEYRRVWSEFSACVERLCAEEETGEGEL